MIETQDTASVTPTVEQGFTVQDLITAANVIDLATRRGAFQASEASDVGLIYNKLTNFIKLAQEANKPPETISDIEVKE